MEEKESKLSEEIRINQTIDKERKQKTKENIDDIKAKVEKIEQKINEISEKQKENKEPLGKNISEMSDRQLQEAKIENNKMESKETGCEEKSFKQKTQDTIVEIKA